MSLLLTVTLQAFMIRKGNKKDYKSKQEKLKFKLWLVKKYYIHSIKKCKFLTIFLGYL